MNLTLDNNQTFTEFKKKFYSTITDISLFDGYTLNALKIVLDGLKVNYVKKYNQRITFDKSLFTYIFFHVLKNLTHVAKNFKKEESQLSPFSVDTLFFSNNIRFLKSKDRLNNYQYQPFLFSKIASIINKDRTVHLTGRLPQEIKKQNYTFNYIEYSKCNYLKNNVFTKKHFSLRKELKFIFNKLKRSGLFSDLDIKNIGIAFQKFLYEYTIYSQILNKYPSVKIIIIEQHYHNESLIYAAKERGIRIIELQHGIISTKDIFYVFPAQVKPFVHKALFPDEIFVFGNYWRKILLNGCEFNDNNIHVIGDFTSQLKELDSLVNDTEIESIIKFKEHNNIILITTQTFMHSIYCTYVEKLSEILNSKYPDWKIIVKIHPNESKDLYHSLLKLSNVYITDYFNLHFLFSLTNIHISVYSTTLFEALKYPNIKNFTLESTIANDYREEIIQNHIAYPLLECDDPIQQNYNYSLLNYDELYSQFNPEKVFSVIAPCYQPQ
ncbi:MAG: hypothetical protein N2114_00635 [Candidatus Goldbacteria bacterium]|nr:hypothetical protein [Candidatus Goldiibacteriota bacterium]